jgi:hypothetical protein
VVPGGVEVAADAAPADEGALGVPVSGDGLVPFRAFDGPLGAVAGPLDGELAGEQPGLLLVLLQPTAQGVAGVVPVVPVPQPVMGDPERGGLVVALAQLGQLSGVQGGVPAGAGLPPPPGAPRAGC